MNSSVRSYFEIFWPKKVQPLCRGKLPPIWAVCTSYFADSTAPGASEAAFATLFQGRKS